MHCPSCRSEYRPGIERCSECGGELLPGDLPDPPDLRLKEPPPDPVTVFTSRDPALFPVARSILEGEEVPFFLRGEELQDLFGIGRLGLGFNPIVGPIEIQVSAADVERARELLAKVEPPKTETEIEEADAGRADTGEADPASIAIPYRPPLASPLSRLEAAAPTAPLVASPRARNCFRFLVAAEAILTLGSWFIQPRWWQEFPTALWNAGLLPSRCAGRGADRDRTVRHGAVADGLDRAALLLAAGAHRLRPGSGAGGSSAPCLAGRASATGSTRWSAA